MSNLICADDWQVVSNELCCQGNTRRIVLTKEIDAKIGEGLSFTIPTGPIGPDDRLKLFVGFRQTCPMNLAVSVNGKPCSKPDFGMDSYLFLKDPKTLVYTIAAYKLTLDNADPSAQTVTVSGDPDGLITYLELKILGQ